jgi:nickel-dependent lactate racemase
MKKGDYYYAGSDNGLSESEICAAVRASLEGLNLKRVLIIPPDFTRFHSNAGLITNICYGLLTGSGCEVDILPAVGTHAPINRDEAALMFGDIPFGRFIAHNWRTDVVKIGTVPAEFIREITEGLWSESIDVQVNRLIMDKRYDLVISTGQVVPHEVAGMANHSKNIFVGIGGSDMINKSHMVGALYGLERVMGKDHTPVRKIFDYCSERFLAGRPILYALTVCASQGGGSKTLGLFIGRGRDVFERAVELSREKNIDYVETGIKKCVVFLDPAEYKSTWLGNKAVYRTRMAVADGGSLLVLAPGVRRFGEDGQVDRMIRKYGYSGRINILEQLMKDENRDLRENMSAAAHLIHGSSDGRFSITYAIKEIAEDEITKVHYNAVGFDEAAKKYDPCKLSYGLNTMAGGEEIFFIPNPALGLWINREKFRT